MRYVGEARRSVALPMGGVGTGHVALCGDGALRQWQLHNVPNHDGFLPDSFFGVRAIGVEPPLEARRLLQSQALPPPTEPASLVTDHLVPYQSRPPTEIWSGVEETVFEEAYPFGRIDYQDPDLPIEVSLEAFTPFVPLDPDGSGLPLVSYRFRLANPGPHLIHGWLLATLQNAVGWDGVTALDGTVGGTYGGNVNRVVRRPGQTAVLLDNPSLAEDDPRFGEMLLWSSARGATLARCASAGDALRWAEALKVVKLLDSGDWGAAALESAIDELPPLMHVPVGPSPAGRTWNAVIAVPFGLHPGSSTTVEFVHAWWFPNRYLNWDQHGPRPVRAPSRIWLGNRYGTRFGGALDALDRYLAERDTLEDASRAWSAGIYASDLPDPVAATIGAQGALVRSPTVFRTADGNFYGFEGSLGASTMNWNGSVGGSCPLNCTHVWNYEQAVASIFPSLERSMRQVDLDVLQGPNGSIPHRLVLPLGSPQLHGTPIGGPTRPALDGMLGTVLKTYREARLGGGVAWLRRYWPNLLRLVEHIDRTWDTDGDGILSGEQPVTYDIALHAPNMYVGSLWLAALRAMEQIALRLELADEANHFRDLFQRASAAYDALLWTGEYYAQVPSAESFDFGSGCLSDQLFGQWWAHQLELGYILPADRVQTALRSIVRHNLRHGFRGFDHGYRVFADADDSGLLVCTWPSGDRPDVPIRYADEVWTGIEYQVAAHCLMEGLTPEGLAILAAVRGRYDGRRRNPYNEIECGDHYARAMAGWSVLDAFTGFRADATMERWRIGSACPRYPFVAGTAWGTVEVGDDRVTVLVKGGEATLRSIDLDEKALPLDGRMRVRAGTQLRLTGDGSIAMVGAERAGD